MSIKVNSSACSLALTDFSLHIKSDLYLDLISGSGNVNAEHIRIRVHRDWLSAGVNLIPKA